MYGEIQLRGRKRNIHAVRDEHGISREHERRQKIDYDARCAFRGGHLTAIGIPADKGGDQLAGTTLGRLYLRYRQDKGDPGAVSEDQYMAGDKWAGIVRRHAGIMGYKLSTASPSFMMVAGGGSGSEPDDELIQRVRKDYRKAFDALMGEAREHGQNIWKVTYGVCVEDWPVGALQSPDYGELRIGLNALRRVL